MGWLVHGSDLTPDQRRLVEAPTDRNRLVLGFPGSGKTQVLVHRAGHLRRQSRSGPGDFLVVIYTNVLKAYIRSGLAELGLPEGSVTTFDSWCIGFYRTRVGRMLPHGAEGKADFALVHRAVLAHLRGHRELWGHLHFALVDEAQDLDPESIEILRLAARHVTVFADPQQQIYEGGATLERIRENLGVSRAETALLATYRNSPDVTALAAMFIGDDEARGQYIRQSRAQIGERERPLFFTAATEDAEFDRLAQAVKGRLVLNQRVGIIVARNQLLHRVASALDARGVHIERAVSASGGGNGAQADFQSPVPKIATFHSAKGLTFDAVFMPRLNETSFVRFRGAQRRRILFVGIARATQWVMLSAVEGEPFEEMGLLEAAAKAGKLVIQRAGMGMNDAVTLVRGDDDLSIL